MIEVLINMVLLTFMGAVTLAIIRLRNLFSVVILAGVYSFLMATVLLVLDAVDVALTEAAVGAGISTVLLLAVLHLTKTEESEPRHRPIVPLLVAAATFAALLYGTKDLPPFGSPDSPGNLHVAPVYLAEAQEKTSVPNVVTAVLASYRGYDTLGEVTVIFTGGIGVLVLLTEGRKRRRRETGTGKKA